MLRRFAAACLLAGCASTDVGTYQAVLPAAAGGEQYLRVTLNQGGTAAVSRTFSERPSELLLDGTWQREGNRIMVNVQEQPMVFKRSGPLLEATEWDRALWGEKGPGVLQRVDR
jgi:hypothetical protein